MPLTNLQKTKVEEFLVRYGNTYNKETLDYIINNFETDIDKVDRPYIMTEIYSSLNILPSKENIYYYLVQKLIEHYNIDRNIIEIGTGFFPAFSKFIYKKQQSLDKGSITVYDPKLARVKNEKVRIVREPLSTKKNIKSFDLITAIVPYKHAEKIIKQAENYKKELFLILCGQTYFEKNYTYNAPISSEKINEIRKLIYTKDNDFIIEEEKVPEKYGVNYLILSKKLKK